MYMNLICPKCGFAFGIGMPDDESEESVREIMTCPCGEMMVKTECLHGNIIPADPAEEG